MDVHVHANCQAIPIAGMLREAYPDWNVTWFEAHGPEIIERFDEHCSRIREVDLVLSQPIHGGYRGQEELSVEWIRENVRRDAKLLIFPSMHFSAHHPGVDGLPLPGLPFLSNLIAAHLIACGCSPDQALQILLSDQLFSDAEIEIEIQGALDEIKRREVDDSIDIWISPFLGANCWSRPLFHIQNHPFRETSVFIANGILERLGCTRRVSIDGYDYQKDTHIPALPAVKRFLRARGGCIGTGQSGEIVLLPGYEPMPQAEYYGDMLERLAEFPPEEVFRVVAARWPAVRILRQLAIQGSSIPGILRWLDA